MQGEQNRLDISNTVISKQRPMCCWPHRRSGDPSPLCPTVPSLRGQSQPWAGWDSESRSHITCHNISLRVVGFPLCSLSPPSSSLALVHWKCMNFGVKSIWCFGSQSHRTYNLGQATDPVWKWAWSSPKVDVFWLPGEADELLQIKVFCNWKGKHKCQLWLPATQPERGSLPRGRQHYVSDTHLSLGRLLCTLLKYNEIFGK